MVQFSGSTDIATVTSGVKTHSLHQHIWLTDKILKAVKDNLRAVPEMKWQYIAWEFDYVINFPAAKICWPNYEPRLR